MIVVLAGRRIDASDAPVPRFPLAQRDRVRQQLLDVFCEEKATTIVCSGACGADLLALDAAHQAHMTRYMLLPFAMSRFREMSVVDRPGEWGIMFDEIYRSVKNEGQSHIKIFPTKHDLVQDLVRLNTKIIEKGIELQGKHLSYTNRIVAVVVWEGKSRGDEDFTAAFAQHAREMGMPVKEILTLDVK